MTEEAKLVDRGSGLVPEGPGWFVVNVAEAAWRRSERFGSYCDFEGGEAFPQYGINVHVIRPGMASCMYHRENQQEDFLVLHGECLLIVEDQERPLKAWDLVHCPAGATHVFVGAGDGPCAILAVGARVGEQTITYPRSEVALARGAGVAETTDSPAEAYRGTPRPVPERHPWPLSTAPAAR